MLFYKDGRTMTADKEQVELVEAQGWSRNKPEDEEVKARALEDARKLVEADDLAKKEADKLAQEEADKLAKEEADKLEEDAKAEDAKVSPKKPVKIVKKK